MVRVGILGENDELARIVGPVAEEVKVSATMAETPKPAPASKRARGFATAQGRSPSRGGSAPWSRTRPPGTRSGVRAGQSA